MGQDDADERSRGLRGTIASILRRTAPSGRPPATRGSRALLALLDPGLAPLDLRIVGRTLLHAALVGLAAGLLGAAFFASLEFAQYVLLEHVAGYVPLRAHGERLLGTAEARPFRWWMLLFLPALGGLGSGLLTRLAPETRGGGGDAAISAFHQNGGVMRRRVIWIKALASIFTLGTGGSGGREGPTMQIGGAIGSFIGRSLKVTALERRVLMVAGVAAGISAVFPCISRKSPHARSHRSTVPHTSTCLQRSWFAG